MDNAASWVAGQPYRGTRHRTHFLLLAGHRAADAADEEAVERGEDQDGGIIMTTVTAIGDAGLTQVALTSLRCMATTRSP